jgi:hypothetical protein
VALIKILFFYCNYNCCTRRNKLDIKIVDEETGNYVNNIGIYNDNISPVMPILHSPPGLR